MSIGCSCFDLIYGDWWDMEERSCGAGDFPGKDVAGIMTTGHSRVIRGNCQRGNRAAFNSCGEAFVNIRPHQILEDLSIPVVPVPMIVFRLC